MLSLDSSEWAQTHACYGGGAAVPRLLKLIHENPYHAQEMKPVWDELWSYLYHQGDIYPASILATPHIVKAGLSAPGNDLDFFVFFIPMSVEESRLRRPSQVSDKLVDEEYNASLISALQLIPRLHREPDDDYESWIRKIRKLLTKQKRGRFLPPQKSAASIEGGLFGAGPSCESTVVPPI
ncbi:MAG: hypothetical protein ACO1TE_20900 [Prosthecobacter sp.]